MSTLAVVEEILRETRIPMSVRQIVEHAGSRLPTKSKTPDTVVARDLSMDLKRKGEASIFIRSSPGRYTLREVYLETLANQDLSQHELVQPLDTGAPPPQPFAQGPTPAAATSTVDNDAVPAPDAAATRPLPEAQPIDAQPTAQPTPLLSNALRAERAGVMPARSPGTPDGQQNTGTPRYP